MKETNMGFIFPEIDKSKCVDCGLCSSVCIYQNNTEKTKSIISYAASSKSKLITNKSSSGGVFYECAKHLLNNGGVVYGAAYTDGLYVCHIRIDTVKDLYRLQGSKYVQSEIGMSYQQAKSDLEQGKSVLFSGTPCQIAGLKNYLKKEHSGLLTIDIICHGVPSQKMFQDYLSTLSSDTIEHFDFRDKTMGWKDFFILWEAKGKKKRIHNQISSYYQLFLNGEIYRDNCYSCQFACSDRVSDITLGDFWGFEQVHPELINDEIWSSQLLSGISCVLLNSENGVDFFSSIKKDLYWYESSIDEITKHNGQLREPSKHTDLRETVFNLYLNDGFSSVERLFNKKIPIKKRIKCKIKSFVPLSLKRKLIRFKR